MTHLLRTTQVKRSSGNCFCYLWRGLKTNSTHQANLSKGNNALEEIPGIWTRLSDFIFKLFTSVISRKCTLNTNIDNTAMTNTPAHIHKHKSSQRGTLIYSISDTVDFLTGLPWVHMASLESGKQEGSAWQIRELGVKLHALPWALLSYKAKALSYWWKGSRASLPMHTLQLGAEEKKNSLFTGKGQQAFLS